MALLIIPVLKGDRELEVRTATYGPGIDQSQHANSVSHIIIGLIVKVSRIPKANLPYSLTQHVLGHHPYTNVDGADPDIQTADEPATDIRRIKWTQKYLTVYVYQHVYVPLVYCFVSTVEPR